LNDKNLAYGEITCSTLLQILTWCNKKQTLQGTFYDLGSGSGKCLIAAALSAYFQQVRGVELLDGLFYES